MTLDPNNLTLSAGDVRDVLGETGLSDAQLDDRLGVARRYYIGALDGEEVAIGRAEDVIVRLAAHLVATGPERQVSSVSESGGNVSFSGSTGEGLMGTTHGQVAATLDPTGQLTEEDDGGDAVIFNG
jgi:hypothetical protein